MKLYIAVTADRYELPICVESTTKELAKFLGVNANSIYTMISRYGKASDGKQKGYKVVALEVEDD